MKRPHKFSLYETSVQDVESENQMFEEMYQAAFGRKPRHLREDFAATFLHCVEWVKQSKNNTAIAVDIDSRPLNYGKKHHLSKLTPEQQRRVRIYQRNVMSVTRPAVDVIGVSNFSVCFLKEREALLKYFRCCYKSLAQKGILSVDLLGGIDLGKPNLEKRKVKLPSGERVTYMWEQESFDPTNQQAMFYIHFKFANGRMWKKAFRYDWRLWSIGEIKDAMTEAGFSETRVYWEGDDHKGGGNGIFKRVETAENCSVWNAYVVGVKGR